MTTRLPLLDPAATAGKVRTLLDGVRARRGHVPGLMQVLAASPAALGGFLGFGTALAGGVLPAALRERIAIATAAANGCAPCLLAHTRLGAAAGLEAAELEAARDGEATDPAARAALAFSAAVLHRNGSVSDTELAAVRAAGWDDASVLEMIAVAYLNAFTNAVNNLARTPPDVLHD